MNRNLSPQEFEEQYLDISPGAGQSFEFQADRDAREAAGMPSHFAGTAGRDNERRAVQSLPPLMSADFLFGESDEPYDQDEVRAADTRWEPPPGRNN